MDEWYFLAERKIQEGMEEGAFDHLEGTGKPLDLSENPFEDPSDRLAHRLLKNNGFAPSWVEEAKEIDTEVRQLLTRREMVKQDYKSRLAALNSKILTFNLKAPALSLHRQLILEEMLVEKKKK